MPELLSDEDKGKALGRLTDWRNDEGAFARTIELTVVAMVGTGLKQTRYRTPG